MLRSCRGGGGGAWLRGSVRYPVTGAVGAFDLTRRRLPARLLPACAAAAVAAGLLTAFLGGAAGAQEMGPTISSVSISSSPANSLFYLTGETIRVSVNFTSVVEVAGSPTLGVDVGGNEREAAFESALGSEVLFAYTVTDDDFDGDGVSVGADKLSLGSGGAITDAGSRAASLTHVAVAGGSGHRVNMSVVTIAADSDEPVPENETAGFTVSRTGSLARELTVSLRGERRQYFVYTGQIPRMVKLEAGQATAQLEVPLVNDSDLETEDGSLAMIVAAGLGYLVGTPGSAVAVLTDDNDPLINIVSARNSSITEGLRPSVALGATLRTAGATRDRPPDRLGFTFSIRNIETTSTRDPSRFPGDIVGIAQERIIEPEDWETRTALHNGRPIRRYVVISNFFVTILDDLEPEIPERFRVIVERSRITYPSTFATELPIESVFTLVDNEGSFDVHADQPRVVDIVEGDVLELGLTAVSRFRFNPLRHTVVGVDLEFVDGTASHGDDFVQLDRSTATTETVEITNFGTIGVGDTERQQATSTVRISAVDNDDVQPVRQFVVNVGKTPIAPDDQDFDADECPGDPPPDTPACYGQNHYLDFFPADLQGDAGLSGYSMVVRIHDDDATPVAVTANESSIDEGGDAVFTVTRNPSAADLPDPLTVGFDITETADFIDYSGGYVLPTSVTIAGNATTATITIPTVDDNVGDGPGEVVATLRPGTVEVGSRYSYTLAGRTASVAVSEDEPVMTIAAASVSEGAGTVDLDVTLSGTSAEAIGFTWATVAGSGDDAATAGQDYQSAGGTVEIDAGDTSATLTVMITDDALDEPDETFGIVLSAVTGASVAQPRATVTVTDNDDPPAFSISDAAATESSGASVDFTVSLDAESGRPTEVAWQAVSDEDDARPATEEVDYQGIGATLTIPPGETQATISVQLLDDGDHEPTETFEVRLADPANSTIADATGEGRILDDDTPVISIDDLSVSESAATAQVRVSLSRPAYDEVSLRYGTAAGTAIATSDYTARSRVAVTVPAGDTTATVSVPILADDVYEADEFFFVDLSDPTLAALSSDIRALITIVDDDSPPTLSVGGAQPVSESAGPLVFTVTRTGATSLPATFSWSTADVTAEAGSDYTAESGTVTIPATMSTAQLSVTVLSDSVAEDDETVAVTLSSPINAVIIDGSATGVIEDDDQTVARTPGVVVNPSALAVTEGGDASYTVELSSQPAADVTVAIIGHAGTDLSLSGTGPSSENTLTFTTADWNTTQTVTVTAAADDDAIDDAAVTLTHTATSGSHSSAPVAVTVTITETDTAAVVVLPTILMVAENGSGTYTVRLATQPSANVTVTVTGQTGTDLSLSGTGLSSNGALSFTTANWNTAQTVTVSAAPDDDGANDRVALTHTAGGGGYGAAEAETVAITVTDDDAATIVVTPLSLTMTEGGSSSYTVELSSPPTADVTVTVSAPEADLTILSVGSRTLRFTPSDWDRPQTVTLAAGYDADTSDNVVILTHTGEGGGYDGQSTALRVTVTDAEGRAELLVVPTSISVREGASGGQTYSVALGSQPTGDVTVTISGHAGTDVTLSGATLTSDALTFTTVNWNAAQVVKVNAAGDADTTNDDETLTNTATGGGYGTATAVDVAVTVVDNDAPALVVTPTEVRVTEGDDAGANYEISLASAPPWLVRVSISPNSTAGAHVDAVWFTIFDWRNPQTIIVTAGDDPDLDDEQVSLNHTVTFGTYAASAVSVRVIVEDDDVPGLAVNPPMLSVIEGASATYDVELTAEPSADVTVAIAGHAGTDVTLSGTGPSSEDTLTFTTGNWNQAQPVTATLGQDSGTTDDAAVTLTHTASGGGYDSLEPVGVLVTLIDDDRPRIDVPAALTVTEGASAGYDVRLAVQPSANVTVTIGGHSGSAVTVSGDTLAGNALTFTTSDWSTAQAVSVTGRDDDDTSNESAVLTHTAAGGDYAGLTAQVAVTVVDDDEPEIILSDSEVTVDEADPDGAVYEVRLATEPSQQVGVEIVGALGTDLTLDPEILTFDSSTWDTVQAVKVTASPDVDAMHEEEQIAHFGSGGEYDGTTKSVTVIVQDGDIPPGVSVSPTSLDVVEGASGTYEVVLTAEPTSDVVVEVDGHTTGGDVTVDGSASAVLLTFTTGSWNTAQTVTVAAVDDGVTEGEESVTLTHGVVGADSATEYVGVAGESVIVTVTDPAGVSVSPTSLDVVEGASGTYEVVLTAEPTSDVVVEVDGHTTGGDVTVDGSASAVLLTFTTGSWNTAQTVTVAAVDDGVTEGEESVTLTHGVVGADSATEYVGVAGESVIVTVTDPAGVSVSPTMLDVVEGASGTYEVVLTAEPTSDVVVEVDGHAGGGDVTVDGSASAVLLTFTTGSWNTAQTVTVAAVDDGVTEGEESVTLTHGVVGADSATEYVGVAGESVIVTVTDPAGVSVSPTSLSITEGSSGSYEVVLTAEPTSDVVVEVDGHAGGGDVTVDGSASAVLLTFTTGSWNTAQTVTVAAVDDGVTEGEESVTLTHGVVGADSATEYVGVAGESVIVTVTDPAGVSVSPTSLSITEGSSGSYEVVLTAEPTSDVVVEVDGHAGGGDVTVDGSASAVLLTFTTGSWNTAQTVTVAAVADGVTEGEESVTLTHGVVGADSAAEYVGVAGESVIVTVTDPAGVSVSPTSLSITEGSSGSYEVVLTAEPTSDVVVEVDGHAGGGDVTVDGSASAVLLTFTTGSWNTAQTVTVAAVDDGVTEGEESVTLTHAVVGADSATEYVGVAGESVIVTVTDPAGVSVSPTLLDVVEGASGTYEVVLTAAPTSDVVVEVDGHTTGGDVTVDGSASAVLLTFTTGSWNTAQTVTVAAVDDGVTEGEESVTLTHAVVGADSATEYVGVAGESVIVTVTDPAGVTVNPTMLSITEGASGTYEVVLTAAPTSDVVVEVDGHTTGGDVTVDGSASAVLLTFTTGSWNTAQTVTVAAVADGVTEGEESVTLTHAVVGADSATEYVGVAGESVIVTVTDPAGVTVNPTMLSITEGASGTYEVVLTAAPTAAVVVEVDGHTTGGDVTVDGSASAVLLTFTTGSWNTAQTVTVAAVADGVTEGEESVTLTHGVVGADSATEYVGVAGESVIVTVTDPAGVTVNPTMLSITEGASGTYEVVLTAAPTSDVVVEVDGHTTGGDVTVDGSASVVLLTFTTGSWNTAQTVTVAAVDDGVTEGEESVTLTHAVVGADSATEYVGVAGESVIVTVTDPAGVSVSPTSLDVVEGASGTYEVVLTAAPTAAVVVEVDGHTTGGDVTVDGSASAVLLTFTTGSWNTAQTVTVAAVADGVTEGEESVTLTHGVVGADSATEYVGVAGESVIVTVTDPAGVSVSPTSLDVVEGASGTYEVVLTAAPTSDVVVEVDGHTTGGDVTVDGSASVVLLTFTTGSWNTAQTVTVAAVDDGVTEGEESVTLTHGVVGADSAAEYVGVAGESVIVTVTDPAGVSVSPTSLDVVEGASGTYEVVLTAAPTAAVVVEVDGHTTGGDVTVDGSASAVLLTFTTGSWNTAQTVTVAAVADGVTEGEESVTLTHAVVGADSATEYVGVAGESVIVTVTDPAGVTVNPTMLDVVEGASGTYEVVLTAEPTAAVVVEVDGHTTGGDVTVDGSASAVLLTFTTGSWNTAQTVTVAAVDDGVTEGEESVTLTHGVVGADSATEYVGVAGESVIVTVTDPAGVTVSPTSLDVVEGASGTYEVVLTAAPTAAVVVEIDGHTTGGDVTVDGSASAVLLTFTTGSWNTAQTVTVAAVDDGVTEGEESVTLTHGVVGADSATEYVGVAGESVIVTVTDPAGVSVSPTMLSITEGGTGTYEVVLTAEPTAAVVVEVDGHTTGGDVTVDGSASAVLLTFTTGSWNTAQTVTVAAVDDGVTEGEESVTLTHGVVGADSATEYVGVAGESVIVTVTDPAGVSVNPTMLSITEGASGSYTVVLTAAPTAAVVVEVDGHTTGGDVTVDGSASAVLLTFTTGSWNTAQTVTVAAVDDGVTEGEESVTLTHAVVGADSATEYVGVAGESVIVTVTDPAGVTVSPTSLDVVEGSSDTYTVELTAEPTGDVVVEIGGHTTGGVVTVDGSSSVVSLTFTTASWNTAQTVTVAAVDDSTAGGTESVSLTHAVKDADSATEYAGVTGAPVTVTVTDNDSAGVTVNPMTLNITEGASGSYTVELTSEPTGDVVVEIGGHTTGGVVTVDGSASVVALTFTTASWNTAQTVTVAAVDDSTAGGTESVSLTHTITDADSAAEYRDVTVASVAVTVTDNDSAGVTVNPTTLNITEGASGSYTVELTSEPTGDVVVEIGGHTTGGVVTVDGSASVVALTFTTASWNTAQTVTVAAVDDSTAGGTESVSLTHTITDADSAAEYRDVTVASVAVTVTDNDSAGVTVNPTTLNITEGASGSYTVELTAEPTADVVVEVGGHTGVGVVTVDGSSSVVSLTFTTGDWNTVQTVTVAAADDDVDDGDESVTLTHAVVDADSATEYAGVTGAPVTVTVTDNDSAGVTVSPTSLSITEGASGSYSVELTSEPTGDVVVEIGGHTTGGVVTVDGSSSVVALTFTTGTWSTAQTVTVAAVDDSTAGGNESVSLTHAVKDADSATEYAGVTGAPVTVTVTDDDSAGVTVNPMTLSISEGASGSYTVELTSEPTGDVVVEIGGHTTGGVVTVDGSSSVVSLTFTTGDWNTVQTVTVAAADDDVDDGDESVTLTHAVVDADSATEYAGVTGASVTVTVTDNDSAGVTVSPTSLSITEGASGSYSVELTAEPTGDVVVEIAGHVGGGVVTVDGSSSVVSLTFTTGTWSTAQTVTVAAVDDSTAGGNESVSLTHAVKDADSATEYAGVTGAPVTVTVTDDDSAGVTVNPMTLSISEGASGSYTVELTSEPTGDVVVEIGGHTTGGVVTVDGSSSVVSLTFTTGDWNTAQTVTVAAVDDSTAGGTESVSLTHAVVDADSAAEYAGVTGASVTVTVTDNDSAGVTVSPTTLNITEGASGSYSVVLTSEPTGDVVVEIGGHAGGGVVTVDGSSAVVALTFTTASWNTAQTVTVAAADDDVDDGDESVSLTHAVVDADSATEYAGVAGAPVTVTVTDNDSAGVTVSPTTLSITEGASGSYSVELTSEPTGDVVVEISGHTGDGVVTVDGSSSVVSLTFTTASWNTAQTVTVAAVDDSTAGGTESVSLTHAVKDADSATEYAGVTGAPVTVTVTDNDSAGVTVNPMTLNITEGASGSYTVELTSEPTGDVVVEIGGHTTGGVVTVDGSSSVVALTFTTASWNTAQTVTVAAVDDSTAGGTESVSLTHTITDADSAAEYRDVTVASVAVTVTDNDSAGVTVNPTSLNITEGASGTYTVVLTSEPTADVVVEIDGHTTGGVVTVDGSSSVVALTFTTGTWNTAQTVTVAAVDDTTAGDTESVSLTHAVVDADSAAEYAGVTGASVTVTVTDNDSAGVTVSFEKDFHRTSEGASGAFATVRLSAALQQAVTIPINVSSTTTAEANDYRLSTDPFQDDPNYAAIPAAGTFDVTFEVGDSAAYFAIRALPDTVFENDETVVLEFGTLPTGVSTGSPSATTFHLIDTQTASFGAASYSATEGGPGATVTVNLDYAVSAIVCLEVENHAGTSDGDYAGVPDDLVFAGTETSRSFVVTVADDADSEGGSITIGLGCLSGELREGSPSSTTVILLDDDPPGGDRGGDSLPAPRGFTATYVTLDGNYYNKTQDSVTLLWWPLDRAVRYKLEYRRTTEGGDWTIVAGDFEEYTGGGNGPVAVAVGLECDTEYDFRLSAAGAEDTDVGGFGAYAETQARTGPCPESALVTNILVATTPACATLHWTAPLDGRAAAYRVRRTDLGQEPAVTTTLTASVAGTTFRHCPPGGYPPGSGYLFWVAALTAGGEVYGEHNSQIEATGPKGPPSVARNLRFTRQSPQVRSLAWDPPVNHWLTTVSEATDGDGYSNEVADPWVSYVVQRGELEPGSVPGHETLVDGTWRDLREVTGTTFSDRENIGGRIFVYRVLAKNLNGFAVGYHPEIWMERPTTSLQRRDAPDVGGLQESDTPPQLQTAEFQENSEVPALPPLTAGYRDAPVSHDGQNSFTFELRFSEEVELSYVTLRDEAFRVTGGTVITARRLNSPSNIRWRIEIQPAPDGDVTVLLPGTTDCGAEGAVCTEDGSKLSNGLALVVSGPA